MDEAIASDAGPDEGNPSYPPDRINDRWPASQEDRRVLRDDMRYVLDRLEEARRSTVPNVVTIFAELFGEAMTRKATEALLNAATEGETKTALGSSAALARSCRLRR